MNKKFYVISHTHWDREWYMPFEKFRLRLVNLINNLLKILEEYPEYIFHLDAQTIVLEDYLAIYPQNEELLKGYIKSGNIVVGPWYVQNDFFLSSGEATIRNLLIGTEIAEKFGKCANVGYTPDQFGLPSQLPQIFKKYGIENHVFARGYAFYNSGDDMNKIPVESDFYWESPDGSSVFSVFMPFWYNNAQRISDDIDLAVERLERSAESFKEWSKSPHLLMMNGVDHLEAQNDLIPILKKVNEKLTDSEIVQANMEETIEKIKPYASDKIVKGELRYGKELDILTGTFSTRVDVKKLNFEAQNMIEHKIEPLYSMIMLAGANNIYPQSEIKYMWKTLIPNHAHDSICCCSNKNVMRHMIDRYLSLEEISEELIDRGAKFINHHIERSEAHGGEYYITVINTSQQDFTGVMDISLDINIKEDTGDFAIYDPDGREVQFSVCSREKDFYPSFSPINLPGLVDVINYKLHLFAENVPAFGYVNYRLKTDCVSEKSDKADVLENEYLKVDFENDTVNITDKLTGVYYPDVLSFEDIGDNGDSYIFVAFENDKPVKAELKSKKLVYVDSLKSEVQLEYIMNVPYAKKDNCRFGEMVQNKIIAKLSLGKGDRALSVDLKIENNSKYHLMRAVINTGVSDDISYASSVFDCLRRDNNDVDREFRNPTQPVNGYVYKKDDKKGFAVFTKGLYEYENADKEILKLSLLRSMDLIAIADEKNRAYNAEDNVMLGVTEVSFAVMPFDGDDSNIHAYEQNINSQPIYYADSTNIKMFTGGRPLVQGSDVDKTYYEKDEYEALCLPQKHQFISINDKVCVTALKKAEKSDSVICRVFNPSSTQIENVAEIENASLIKTDLREEKSEVFENTIDKKEILSFMIK